MERLENNFNDAPENFNLGSLDQVSSPEIEEYVPQFFVTQEALQFYGIDVHERTPENPSIEGTLDDREIKRKIYDTLVQELQSGNTHLLEFILSEKLLTKYELHDYGIDTQKETAKKILKNMTGQQRAKDIDSFLESGIFTENEALDLKYSA